VHQPFLKGGLFVGKGRPLSLRKDAGDGHSEHYHQVRLVSWARETGKLQSDPARAEALHFLHSIPNGVFLERTRGAIQMYKLLAAGLTPGVTDLRLDYVVRVDGQIVSPGLVIEMKVRGEKPEGEQARYLEHVRGQGYWGEVCNYWQAGARAIVEYMGLERYAVIT
jgi:hypothetical protein